MTFYRSWNKTPIQFVLWKVTYHVSIGLNRANCTTRLELVPISYNKIASLQYWAREPCGRASQTCFAAMLVLACWKAIQRSFAEMLLLARWRLSQRFSSGSWTWKRVTYNLSARVRRQCPCGMMEGFSEDFDGFTRLKTLLRANWCSSQYVGEFLINSCAHHDNTGRFMRQRLL